MNVQNTDDFDELARHLENKAIWLDPISMYPDSGNPIVALMVRIDNAMSVFGYQGYEPGCPPLYDDTSDRAHSWRWAQYAAAVGFPGNLPQRAPHLDIDSYAIDAMQAENCRLNFKPQFQKGLEGLVQYLGRRGICREPIFCLPLLDYDINFVEHQKIVDQLQHFLIDPIEVFIVADCATPISIRRNVDRFHILDTRQFNELVRRVNEGSWHLKQAQEYENRWPRR